MRVKGWTDETVLELKCCKSEITVSVDSCSMAVDDMSLGVDTYYKAML